MNTFNWNMNKDKAQGPNTNSCPISLMKDTHIYRKGDRNKKICSFKNPTEKNTLKPVSLWPI